MKPSLPHHQFKRFFTKLVLLFLSLTMFALGNSAIADTGFDWLAIQYQVNGSYSAPNDAGTTFQSTAETLRTFNLLGTGVPASEGSSLQFLDTETYHNTENLTRKIIARSDAGIDSLVLITELINHANVQGGFGESSGYQVTVLDSALALEALSYSNNGDTPAAMGAINYLLGAQNPDGSWHEGGNSASVYLTALAARSLLPFSRGDSVVSDALILARNYLLSRRDANGTWQSDFDSAQALLTLVTLVSDISSIQLSAEALIARQDADGSWSGDVFTTAIALRALWRYEGRSGSNDVTGTGTLTGYVVKAGSSEPLYDAFVSLGSSPDTVVSTGSDGYFVITGIMPGIQTVVAQKTGYTGTSSIATVYTGQTSHVGNLVLDIDGQTAIVSGRITDDVTGLGIQGVVVSLDGTRTYSVEADALGYFEMLAIVPDAYTLSIQKAGYYSQSGSVSTVAGNNLTINQGLIQEGAFLNSDPADLTGLIVDASNGQPVVGATFALSNGTSIVTGSDGRFVVNNLARNTYQATLSSQGYNTLNLSIMFSAGVGGDMGAIALHRFDGSAAPATLTLIGSVIDGVTNAPISGALIEQALTGESWTADSQGQFTITDLAALDIQLSISAPQHETRIYSVSVSAYGVAEQQFLLSPSTGPSSAVSSTITGTVTDQVTGNPLPGVWLAIEGTEFSALTDSNGQFVIGGIDALEFVLTTSAVDHLSSVRQVQLSAHGTFEINIALGMLSELAPDIFQIVSLSQPQATASANEVVLFSARIANLSAEPQDALIIGEVFDANGQSVADISPYAEGTEITQSLFSFAPEETKELRVPWNTLQLPAGAYRVVLRVVQAGSISRALPTGVVLTELSSYADIAETQAISGSLDFNPPLTQAGSQTPVSLNALVINKGNTALDHAGLTLTITDPVNGSVIHSATATVPYLEIGNHLLLSFGEWRPVVEGDLQALVSADNSVIAGAIAGNLYVGDKASGSFALDKNIVSDGTHTVQATINLEGVDTATGTSTDPLAFAVKEAIRTGAAYTGANTLAWQRSKRCMGCHVQTQGLVGTASAFQRRLGDEFHANALYNSTAGSQQGDGGLRANHPHYTRTQTALGLWALTAWNDLTASFRTMYQAAAHMYDRRVQSGNQTWWVPDHVSGWWRSPESHTAMVVKSYVKLLQGVEQMDMSSINDYQLPQFSDLGLGNNPVDTEMGPDGLLYTVKYTGSVVRTDLQTGVTETVVPTIPIQGYGIDIDTDGSIYVTGNPGKLLHYNLDGSVETVVLTGGYLTDVEIGPDGLLYVVDYSNHRILRVTRAGQMTVLASGGLLKRPYGLTFGDDGHIYIANFEGYNILKLTTDGQLSIFADGLPYRPLYITQDLNGGFYFSTARHSSQRQFTPGGVNHLSANGLMERLSSVGQPIGVVATDDGRVFAADNITHDLHELTAAPLDTALLPSFRVEVDRAAQYFLANYADGTTNTIVQTMRLMGLAEARKVTTDASLNTQIDEAIGSIADTLRSRQRADGGWGKFVNYDSDAMVTALVGLALDYTNPSVDDPVVRAAIIYLLNNQNADHSWRSRNGILTTNLAATSLVISYLPVALDRLGGIDVDLSLNLPADITLNNPSTDVGTIQAQADGTTTYDWQLQGVTGSGRTVAFDLTFNDMQLNEVRQAANDAHIGFANSFSGELLLVDLPIPSLKAKSETGLFLTTDNTLYGADELVTIPLTITNIGPTSSDTIVELSIRGVGAATPVATLPSVPVGVLQAGTEINLSSSWNTADTLVGPYEVVGRLIDTTGRRLDESLAPIEMIQSGPVLDTTVTTDKPLYQAWDQVNITGRVINVSRNAIQPPSLIKMTVKDPSGQVIFTQTANLNEMLPGVLSDRAFTLALVDVQSGVYPVEMVVKDAFSHEIIDTAATNFQVERLAIQALTGQVSATPVQVQAGEPVACTETIQNIGSATLASVQLTSQLINMDTELVISESQRTSTLEGGQQSIDSRTVPTNGLAVGAYACVLAAVVQGQRRILGVSGFDVQEPPINIEGTLGLGGRGRLLVLVDEASQQCNGFTRIGAEATLTTPLGLGAVVTTTLYDTVGNIIDQEIGQLDDRLIDLQVGTAGINLVVDDIAPTHIAASVNASATLGDGYQLVIEISDGAILETLDSKIINTNCATAPAVGDLFGDLHLNSLERVPAANDPLGPNHMPDLQTQRDTLEMLLSEVGWSYTLVSSADDFARELRTGGYVTYLLLSERVKLDETLQKELREAVYRGEGLVEAGSHDQRQGRIDEALGVKFNGKHPSMQGFSVSNNTHTSVMGANYQLTDRTLKATLQDAILIATFTDQNIVTNDPAVTIFDYGHGRSIYVGFDLAAEASLPNADPSFSNLLLDALMAVHPVTLPAHAHGTLPLRLTLDNLGIATPGQVMMTLPPEVTIVDPDSAIVNGRSLTWSFDLPELAHLELDAWIKIPEIPLELSALIQSGMAPDWVDQGTLTMTITPAALQSVDDAYTHALEMAGNAYKQVKKYLGWAQEDSAAGRWADALSALLRASDALIAIGTPESDALRVEVAQAIKTVAINL